MRLSQLLLDKPKRAGARRADQSSGPFPRERLWKPRWPGSRERSSVHKPRSISFLDKVAHRLFVLDPPKRDGLLPAGIASGFANWTRTSRKKQLEPASKPKPKTATAPREPGKEKRDNPYARPFGRLTLARAGTADHDSEIAIAECQNSFGDSGLIQRPDARSEAPVGIRVPRETARSPGG